MKLGDHVIYYGLAGRQNALVTVSFTEPHPPHLTLCMIKLSGETQIRSYIPHRSKLNGNKANGYWIHPAEEEETQFKVQNA